MILQSCSALKIFFGKYCRPLSNWCDLIDHQNLDQKFCTLEELWLNYSYKTSLAQWCHWVHCISCSLQVFLKHLCWFKVGSYSTDFCLASWPTSSWASVCEGTLIIGWYNTKFIVLSTIASLPDPKVDKRSPKPWNYHNASALLLELFSFSVCQLLNSWTLTLSQYKRGQ